MAGAARSSGKRGKRFEQRSGKHVRSVPVTHTSHPWVLDPSATIKSAFLRCGARQQPLAMEAADVRCKVYQRPRRSLIVFLVDASESMVADAASRMKAARGAILALLTGAYQRRDRVALVVFRGEKADILLQPTASVELAKKQLRRLPVGGATPFADGLLRARQLLEVSQRQQPELPAMLVIVSDGEANVPLQPGADVLTELQRVAAPLARMQLRILIVDTSSAIGGSRSLRQLSELVGGDYQRLRDLDSGRLYRLILEMESS